MAVLPAGRGLYINAHEIATEGTHTAWRLLGGRVARQQRHALAERHGVAIFLDRGVAYAVEPLDADVAGAVVYDIAQHADLHRFLLREGLLRQAVFAGFEAWIGFGGEIGCADSQHALLADGPVRVEPVLNLRVAREGALEDLTVLVARRNVRWRFAETLASPLFAAIAPGETAMRVDGDGPRRARVIAVEGDTLKLARGTGGVEMPASSYALSANAALVYRVLRETGSDQAEQTVRRAWQASAARLPNGRPNEYAIQEREAAALGMLDQLGWEFDLPDGSRAHIARQPIEVKVRG
jgi:hypothetical protein